MQPFSLNCLFMARIPKTIIEMWCLCCCFGKTKTKNCLKVQWRRIIFLVFKSAFWGFVLLKTSLFHWEMWIFRNNSCTRKSPTVATIEKHFSYYSHLNTWTGIKCYKYSYISKIYLPSMFSLYPFWKSPTAKLRCRRL